MRAILDTRAAREFLAGHDPEAVNIPLEELAGRVHELPATGTPIHLFDDEAARVRAAVRFLEERGHPVQVVAASLTSSGPSKARLWQPNPFLAEALERIGPPKASASAIDVACGTGRDAVFLALAGYRVTAIDYLPDALERAGDLASRYGLEIQTVCHDLGRTGTIPVAPADLVCVFRYLHRPLFGALREAVRPGGVVAYETFHVRNLETNRPPRNRSHLLETGELLQAFGGFEILLSGDAVEREGRYFSHILARRPVSPGAGSRLDYSAP